MDSTPRTRTRRDSLSDEDMEDHDVPVTPAPHHGIVQHALLDALRASGGTVQTRRTREKEAEREKMNKTPSRTPALNGRQVLSQHRKLFYEYDRTVNAFNEHIANMKSDHERSLASVTAQHERSLASVTAQHEINLASVTTQFQDQLRCLRAENEHLKGKVEKLDSKLGRMTEESQVMGVSKDYIINQLKRKVDDVILKQDCIQPKVKRDAIVKPAHLLGRHQRVNRANKLLDSFMSFCGPITMSEDEKRESIDCLLDSIKYRHPDHPVAASFCPTAKKLTSFETVHLMYECGLTGSALQKMVKALREKQIQTHPFASYREIRYLKESLNISNDLSHKTVTVDETEHQVTWFSNPGKIMTEIVKQMYISGDLKTHNGSLRMMLIGDKGGNDTKLGIVFFDHVKGQSVHNLQLLAIYNGPEKYTHLKECLKEFAREFNKIKALSFTVDNQTHEYSLQKFLGGDFMFISTVIGHQGPSCTYFCPFCHISSADKSIRNRRQCPKVKLSLKRDGTGTASDTALIQLSGDKRMVNVSRTFPARTLTNITENSKLHLNSIKDLPLFNIPVTNIVPPILHSFMGAFDVLDKIAEKIAIDEIADEGKKLQCKTLKGELKMVERELAGYQKEKDEIEEERAILAATYHGSIRVEARANPFIPGACGFACLVDTELADQIPNRLRKKYKCSACNIPRHRICDLIITKEDEQHLMRQLSNKNNRPVCKVCDAAGSWCGKEMTKQIDLKVDQLVNYEKSIDDGRMEKALERRKEIEDLIMNNVGIVAQEYERKKNEVGLDKSAYFQSYNGNQIHKALKGDNYTIICSAFSSSTNPKIPHLTEAFMQLGKMQSSARAIDITDNGMDEYRHAKNRFFAALEKLNPELNLTPKLHLLDAHVLTFMQRHQAWGKCAEQSIEAKHARFNQKGRKHANTKRDIRTHRTRILNELWIETLNFINPSYSYEDSINEIRDSVNQTRRKKYAISKGIISDEPSDSEFDVVSDAESTGEEDIRDWEIEQEDIRDWEIEQEDPAETNYDSDIERKTF